MPQLQLEVCVDSVESAIAAKLGGATRLEICGNLGIGGGTTPSFGLVKAIRAAVSDLPLMVMIRPRCGDFLYSESEFLVMKEDIQAFKTLFVQGFVFGILSANGTIDIERTKTLVLESGPLAVTFHRAFDTSNDLDQALIDISQIDGVSRILTSGGAPNVQGGLTTLARLLHNAPSTLIIMPGSGVNAEAAPDILTSLSPYGLQELHMSGGSWRVGDMKWKIGGLGMGCSNDQEWNVWRTCRTKVEAVRQILDRHEISLQ